MFALCSISSFDMINLKCDPDKAEELRANYLCVEGAFHMNKKHWNSIYLNRDMGDDEVLKWIDHSYNLVVEGLPKSVKDALFPKTCRRR